MRQRWQGRVTRAVTVAVLVASILSFWGSAPTPTVAAPQTSSALAWGRNNSGQLGKGGAIPGTDSSTPAPVGSLSSLVAVAAGGSHGLALAAGGTVTAWGDNSKGQLGTGGAVPGTSSSSPVTVCASGSGVNCPALSGVVAIAAGELHSLALLNDGTVKTWGDNTFGQLGNGAALPAAASSTPVTVGGLTNVVAIATHLYHNLALLSDGTVKAWGFNGNGQLGNGDAALGTDSSTPVTVLDVGGTGTLASVIAIAAGNTHSLALLGDGTVRAWGNQSFGQLGNGNTNTNAPDITSPVVVCASGSGCTAASGAFTGVAAIAAGGLHNLALLSDGTMRAWGNNARGQLGNGDAAVGTNSGNPVRVCASGGGGACPTLGNVAAIASGGDAFDSHNLALLGDGSVMAWGYNQYGQLGDGGALPGTNTSLPAPVCASGSGGGCVPLADVAAIAAGKLHNVVLRNPSATVGWGAGTFGQLGNGVPTNRIAPTPALPLNVVAVATGVQHSLALLSDGSVKAWGDNQYGQLGGGTSGAGLKSAVPVAVCASGSGPNCPRLTNVVAIATGTFHSLALLGDGTIKAWGRNNSGQLGDGTTTDRSLPAPVCASGSGAACPALANVAAIAGGGLTVGANPAAVSVALLRDGTVKSWGFSGNALPVTVSGLTNVVAIGAGNSTHVALLGDGTVKTWVNGGTATDVCTSGSGANCQHLANVVAVAAGLQHRLALLADGSVMAWGNDPFGQLGTGGGGGFATNPVQVSGLGAGSGVVAIAGGVSHSMALLGDGSVMVWGQWGAGMAFSVPTTVTGLTNAVAIAGGNSDNLVVRGTPTNLAAAATAPSIPYGGTATLTATLTATTGGAGLAGQTVRFWLNGQVRCGTGTLPTCPVTNASGVATLAGVATTGLAPGSYPVVAHYAGAENFAPEIGSATLTVVKASQTITFGALANRMPGETFPVGATATSGLTVTFSSLTPTVCIVTNPVSGSVVLLQGVEGTCTLRAGQAGNANYNAAPTVDQSFTATRANQTITFDPLANMLTTDQPFAVTADATSHQVVTFASLTTGVCILSNPNSPNQFVVTLTGTTGTCTLRASQEGDTNYNPAPTVDQSFSVTTPTPSPSPSPSPGAPVTLTVSTAGTGSGSATPPGTTTYTTGQAATLTASPAAGSTFAGWTLDGTLVSWATSITLTMNATHAVVATFQPLPAFTDVPSGQPFTDPVQQLAARGIINGCFTDPNTGAKDFCPSENTLRHQMAALIARAMPGWVSETGLPSFGDNTDDTELMTRVATLQRHNVVRGYQANLCAERGIATPPGCYGPLDTVKYGQVMLFIARAMVEKGYWTLQTDDRTIFPDQNGAVGAPADDQQTRDHRMVVTYVFYVQSVPDVADVHANFVLTNGQGWADSAPRAWFTRAFWPALQSYFGADNVP